MRRWAPAAGRRRRLSLGGLLPTYLLPLPAGPPRTAFPCSTTLLRLEHLLCLPTCRPQPSRRSLREHRKLTPKAAAALAGEGDYEEEEEEEVDVEFEEAKALRR